MSKGSAVKIIKINCTSCNKEFEITEWKYYHRLERNKNRGVFCSPRCGQIGKKLSEEHRKKITNGLIKAHEQDSYITINCVNCNKEFVIRRWEYNDRIKRNQRGIFCSSKCSLIGKNPSNETREKISQSQKGKSVLTRGRPGHVLTEETKEKIRQSKLQLNKKIIPDWEIVHKAAEIQNLKKYVITRAPIPDILFVDENGKLVAVEVEKKKWENEVRKKMDMHTLNTGYDKVILMWFLPTGEFQKQWVFENGKWTSVLG